MVRKRAATKTSPLTTDSPLAKLMSSNPILHLIHNKWRYYTRKHKALKTEVILGLIILIFACLNYLPRMLMGSSAASSNGYIPNTQECVPILDESGQNMLDDDGNEICQEVEETDEDVDDEDLDEGEESDGNWLKDIGFGGFFFLLLVTKKCIPRSLSQNIKYPLFMFTMEAFVGFKARLREWWTGDNPGYRQISPDSVPVEQRQYSFDADFLAAAPNPRFVFHNKLPKTGSTTMHNIVGLLSRRNNFTYWKIMSGVMKFGDESTLVQALRMRYREPFFLLQHHYWMDFEQYDMVQPTFVNLIREPVEWFQSHYSFMKYGANSRKANSGVENLSKDIEQCIEEEDKLCTGNPWTYIEFFCGSDKFCNQIKNGDDESKAKVLDIAKRRVVHQYFVVGILEQFEDTLRMFETMMPDFYSGAMTAWRSDYIQFRRNQTKTIKGEPLTPAARDFLVHEALKYETDFYYFCRFLFNERLRALQIEPSTNTNT